MIVKDEIHGTIEFNELEEKIIDTPLFQRLRRIRQMSITNLVYPGANHTRFEHSLGTAHLSSTIAERLGLDDDTAGKVKLFALLHDLGHTAFSHEGEDVLKKYLGDHESIGRKLILSGEVADLLSDQYTPREINEIAGMEKSNYGAIVSSDLGADRMDYLKRDALNTGVAYGVIDIDRIVHTLMIEPGDHGKPGRLCISKGGLEAAENLLVARFIMFSAVYMHRTVRIATAMLYRAIEGAVSDKAVLPAQFLELGDDSALALMCRSKTGGKYATALMDRRLYKEVISVPFGSLPGGSGGQQQPGGTGRAYHNRAGRNKRCEDCNDWAGKKAGWTEVWAEKTIRAAEDQVRSALGCDVIIDYPHEFFKPVEFEVRGDDGVMNKIGNVSTLVQSLKKSEDERRQVLVLADAADRKKYGKQIIRVLRDLLPSLQESCLLAGR